MPKYFLLGFALFLSGCVTTIGSEEVSRLHYGLARMHKQTKESLKKIEKKELALEKRVTVLEGESRDFKRALAEKEGLSSQEKANQLFQIVYNDYLNGQFSLAIMGFREYLRLYPEGARAAEGQYWLAECCFSQKDFKSAVEEFDKLVKNYPGSDWVAPALYKKALGLLKEEKAAESLLILEEIMNKFPKSKEAKLAEELKKELEN